MGIKRFSLLGVLVLLMGLAACGGGGNGDATDTPEDPIETKPPTQLGGTCQTGAECGSGQCVDGVCCDTACDSSCSACNLAATGKPDGTCAPVLDGKDPANECGETACGTAACNGAGACGVLPSTSMCRDAAGLCDVAEMCDGQSLECPVDRLKAQGSSCRAAAGTCDVAELCTGASVDCPADRVEPNTKACSTNYECNGTATSCPTSCTSDFDCVGDRACISNACVLGVRAFVTSTTTNGNIGGLAGADAFCQGRANAAGLKGTYKAWLSDSNNSPSTRFAPSAVPYYMTNGIKVADSYPDLVDGVFNRIPYVSEAGAALPQNVPFTGTAPNGTALDPATPLQSNCNGWTSNAAAHHAWCGVSGDYAGEAAWTQSSNTGSARQCDVLHRLYCFAQPATVISNN